METLVIKDRIEDAYRHMRRKVDKHIKYGSFRAACASARSYLKLIAFLRWKLAIAASGNAGVACPDWSTRNRQELPDNQCPLATGFRPETDYLDLAA